MALPLPNLDDRRWADLVEEARALIPLHAPDWTDHNAHDPGMTLVDLLAWVTEADLYGINRIRASHLRRFLALVGLQPSGPAPSHIVVGFARLVSDGSDAAPIRLPASTEVEAATGGGEPAGTDGGARRTPVRFRTTRALEVQAARLAALQVRGRSGFLDLTPRWEQGDEIEFLGPDPCPGDELYLGFDGRIAPGSELTLYLRLARDEGGSWRSGDEGRRRLLEEAAAAHLHCAAPVGECGEGPADCGGPDAGAEEEGEMESEGYGGGDPTRTQGPREAPPPHHSVRLVWEYRRPPGEWGPVEGVRDETREMTLDGSIDLRIPDGPGTYPAVLGEAEAPLHYVRCRLERGRFDAPPRGRLAPNAVRAVQATPAASTWEVGATVAAPPALEPGMQTAFELTFEPTPALLPPGVQARLTAVSISAAPTSGQPLLRVLRYLPPNGELAGLLDVEAEWLGRATGAPGEQFALARRLVLPDALRVFTVGPSGWRAWERREDLLGSRRGDRHFRLDVGEGAIEFGDGDRGRAAPTGADVVAVYDATEGEAGNLARGASVTIPRSLHNAALVPDLDSVRLTLEASSPMEGRGGAPPESLGSALGRAFVLREERTRAVTLEDFEALARETPGTRIARVRAWPDVHADFSCYAAPGVITVVVLPYLPAARPTPTAALLRLVHAYLARRALLGTRIVVTGPRYRRLAVHAAVRALPGADPQAIPGRAASALDTFFHPLRGGPDGEGWPIGRDVFRSEVLQVLDETPGVDHVVSLELIGGCGEPSCGNLCLGPTELIAVAPHRIEVVP
jgi:hypothetical protein